MIFDKDINKLIKELEAEMSTCNEEDQFGYAKIDAWDVYKSIIKRLREINITEYRDVDEYYRDGFNDIKL